MLLPFSLFNESHENLPPRIIEPLSSRARAPIFLVILASARAYRATCPQIESSFHPQRGHRFDLHRCSCRDKYRE